MPTSLYRQVATAALLLLPFASAGSILDPLAALRNVPQTEYRNATQANTGAVSSKLPLEALKSVIPPSLESIISQGLSSLFPRGEKEARADSYTSYKTVLYFPNWVSLPNRSQ
jgi:hypothetical protein